MKFKNIKMASEYIKQRYGIETYYGQEVKVNGKLGVVVRDDGHYIGVNFYYQKNTSVSSCHPTWKVEYLGKGNIRPMTRSQRRYRYYLEVSECYDSFLHFLQRTTYKP